MNTDPARKNAPDAGQGIEGNENHPPTKQEQISMTDDTAQVTPGAIDADAAMVARCNERIGAAATITTRFVGELLDDEVVPLRGALYTADEDRRECIAFRMSHSDDKEWQRTEFWSNVFKLEFENSSPQGFEWQQDNGLWVHDEPLNEWPRVTAESGSNVVQIHRFDRLLSDGTVTPMVGIEAPNGELTYDEVHTLIDQLKEAARSLVAADDAEGGN